MFLPMPRSSGRASRFLPIALFSVSDESNTISVTKQTVYGRGPARSGGFPAPGAIPRLLFIAAAWAAFAACRVYGDARYTPDPRVVRIAALEEPLPIEELIRISLIASGTPQEGMEDRIAAIAAIVSSAPPAADRSVRDGEVLLEWMHEEHLSRYVEDQTRLDILMDSGTYNCVSSAVFYLILARGRGVPVHGVLTTDHAFCRIPTGGEGGVDVETTTPYGFDPGTRKDAVDSFSGRTGFAYVPPGNYRLRRDIGGKELVSLIYQNRISAMQRRGDWAGTVGLARDRWALTGSAAAEDDFRTALTNYAAEMDRRRAYDDGLRFLGRAVGELDGEDGLGDVATALLSNGVTHRLRAGRTDEARALLEDGELIALVPAEVVASRLADIARAELDAVVKSGDFERALRAADDAVVSGLVDRPRWEETMLYLWSTEARRRSSGGNWIEGWNLLLAAPSSVSSIPHWADLEESYRHNAAVVYHNRFADAFRRDRLGDARTILDEALALFPDDPSLIRDLRTLESREGGG